MSKYYLLIILGTFIGAFGGFAFKNSTSKLKNFKDILFNIWLYFGTILYLVCAIINIYVLKYLPYSVVLPFMSITYIWTMLISYFLLKEKISYKKIVGVLFIIFGVYVISNF